MRLFGTRYLRQEQRAHKELRPLQFHHPRLASVAHTRYLQRALLKQRLKGGV